MCMKVVRNLCAHTTRERNFIHLLVCYESMLELKVVLGSVRNVQGILIACNRILEFFFSVCCLASIGAIMRSLAGLHASTLVN